MSKIRPFYGLKHELLSRLTRRSQRRLRSYGTGLWEAQKSIIDAYDHSNYFFSVQSVDFLDFFHQYPIVPNGVLLRLSRWYSAAQQCELHTGLDIRNRRNG